jgi:hypothetical protein
MRIYLVIWLRTASLGASAFIAAIFMPLSAGASTSKRMAARPDPIFSLPPAGAFLLTPADAEAHILAALERHLASLSDDIAGLRLSLEAMSPLPDQDEFYIPIDPANLEGEPVFHSGVSPLVDLYLSERDRADTAKLMAEWSPVSIAA